MSRIAGPGRSRSPHDLLRYRLPTLDIMRSIRRYGLVYCLIALFVCSIYVIEKAAAILDGALQYHYPLSTVGELLLYTWPALFDFSLPLACLASVYFLLMARRERRELLVLSAAGAGWAHIALGVLGAAGLAMVLSLVFSGLVRPAASFRFHAAQQNARNEVLAHGVPSGSFFADENTVLHVQANEARPDNAIRLFQFHGGHLGRVVASQCATMRLDKGMVLTDICRGRIYFLRPVANVDTGYEAVGISTGKTRYPVDMSRIFRTPERNRTAEMNLVELVRDGAGPNGRPDYLVVAIADWLAAVTCLLAAGTAVAAVALTRRNTGAFVFPAACAFVAGLMAGRQALAAAIASLGSTAAIAGVCLFALLAAAILVTALVGGFHDRLVAPAMGKA